MTQEQEKQIEVFDLELENDQGTLEAELGQESMYFKPQKDINYKVELLSTKVTPIDKNFNGDEVRKYQIEITARNKAGETFTGMWEVGNSILRPILNAYKQDKTKKFILLRTGTGTDTRYSITPDEDF